MKIELLVFKWKCDDLLLKLDSELVLFTSSVGGDSLRVVGPSHQLDLA